MGLVYLIHFSKPLQHANHYIGWCDDGNLENRIARHKGGNGSKLMRAVVQAGINWEVVRVWEGVDRNFERKLKQRKRTRDWCPICRAGKPILDLKKQ